MTCSEISLDVALKPSTTQISIDDGVLWLEEILTVDVQAIVFECDIVAPMECWPVKGIEYIGKGSWAL